MMINDLCALPITGRNSGIFSILVQGVLFTHVSNACINIIFCISNHVHYRHLAQFFLTAATIVIKLGHTTTLDGIDSIVLKWRGEKDALW